MKIKSYLSLLISIPLLSSCTKNSMDGLSGHNLSLKNNQNINKISGSHPIRNQAFTVTDESLNPIAGAKILIGQSLGNPQAGNFIQTDQFGKVAIPFEFNDQPITISADGFLRQTVFNQDSVSKTFKLKTSDLADRIEIMGQTTGFGNLPNDGQADFGLVLSALSKRELYSFNQNLIISPETDNFDVAGSSHKIPSNLTFPRQKESYIIPITLNKEQYRMYFSNPGSKTIIALRGQFPFKKVVDALRDGQKLSTLINDFSIKSVGITDMIFKAKTNLDLPVNQIAFTGRTTITAPTNIGPENSLLALPLLKYKNTYIPTDIKNLTDGQVVTISTPTQGDLYLLEVFQKKGQYRSGNNAMSLTIYPLTKSSTLTQLGTFDLNSTSSQGWISNYPSSSNQVQETATYSVLSSIQTNGNVTLRNRKWEVITKGWVNQMSLPQWPEPTDYDLLSDIVANSQRWEVSFLGNQTAELFDFDSDLIDTVSHVSYNSKDF